MQLQSYARTAKLFQSTPSARRATRPDPRRELWILISIHALREEGDLLPSMAARARAISIHALREEGDYADPPWSYRQHDFNPRPPRGGRLINEAYSGGGLKFQSTPSARRATRRTAFPSQMVLISIHALREEGDKISSGIRVFLQLISIHALREEGDSKSGEKIHHVCSIIHTCAQFEKELYEGSGEMQNKSC